MIVFAQSALSVTKLVIGPDISGNDECRFSWHEAFKCEVEIQVSLAGCSYCSCLIRVRVRLHVLPLQWLKHDFSFSSILKAGLTHQNSQHADSCVTPSACD